MKSNVQVQQKRSGRVGQHSRSGRCSPNRSGDCLFAFLVWIGSVSFSDITRPLWPVPPQLWWATPKTCRSRRHKQRRVIQLAVKLMNRIEGNVNLRKAGNSVAKVYNLVSTNHIGSLENGYGLPSPHDQGGSL